MPVTHILIKILTARSNPRSTTSGKTFARKILDTVRQGKCREYMSGGGNDGCHPVIYRLKTQSTRLLCACPSTAGTRQRPGHNGPKYDIYSRGGACT